MAEESDQPIKLIAWDFNEYDPEPRSNAWYLWYGILAAGLTIYAVFTDNYLFAIIAILVTLIVFLRNWRSPDKIHFAVTPRGIQVGNKFFYMRDIDEFWIVYEPPVQMVYFNFKSSFRPALGIPLADTNPLQVRDILLDYLQENLDSEEEPFSDGMARIMRL